MGRKLTLTALIIACLIPVVAMTNLDKLNDNNSMFFVVPMLMGFGGVFFGQYRHLQIRFLFRVKSF